MVYDKFTAAITEFTKDKILGFIIDNSRRVTRRRISGVMESYDDRFDINVALEALIIKESDIKGYPVNICTPIENIQGIVYVDNVEDLPKIDPRYIIG